MTFEEHWDEIDKASAKDWYTLGLNDAKAQIKRDEFDVAYYKQLAQRYKQNRDYWTARNEEIRNKIMELIQEATPNG